MTVRITEDCIACGLCVDICPEVFEMGEQYAEVKVSSIQKENEEAVRKAADECPVSAIIVSE